MQTKEWYKKNWRKLQPNELPKIGDAWFGGGPAYRFPPKIMDEDDSMDPVGLQDGAIFRNPLDKGIEIWNG